jgi:hypothetical protein
MSLTTSLKRAPVLEGELDFVQSLKLTLYRTARSTKVVPTQENFDKVYGQGKVEIFAIDDLIGGDFTATLKGQQMWFVSDVSSFVSGFQISLLSSTSLLLISVASMPKPP